MCCVQSMESFTYSTMKGFFVVTILEMVICISAGDLCSTIHDNTGCIANATLTGPQGWIINRDYPVSQATSSCEIWHISFNRGQTITISFEDFDVSGKSCDSSLVVIGPSPCTVLCGSRYPITYLSKSSDVWIKYVYRESSGVLHRGFRLKYLIGSVPSSESCFASGMHQCGNGKCIFPSWVCNGVAECEDSSDEAACFQIVPTREPPSGYSCGIGKFGCLDRSTGIYRCYRDQYKCDGVSVCANGDDEKGCDVLNRPCEQQWLTDSSGWIASTINTGCSSANCRNCQSVICIAGRGPIQLRFQALLPNDFEYTSYIDIHDGKTSEGKLIKRLRAGSLLTPIESTENCISIRLYADPTYRVTLAFNATYQEKGVCLPDQYACSNERDCYQLTDRCNNVWNCPLFGSDELRCGVCDDKYSCSLSSGRCYSFHERCDGVSQCISMVDELHCGADKCGRHNGTFLCDASQCIQERLVCDGNNDCYDRSDERDCPLPAKVILCAVVGSLCCGLLLSLALGIARRFYVLQVSSATNRSARHLSPVTAIEEQIFEQQSAPPPYLEAIVVSRPYADYQREILERHLQRQEQLGSTLPPATTLSGQMQIQETAISGDDFVAANNDDDDDDDLIDVTADHPLDVGDSSSGVSSRRQRRLSKELTVEARSGDIDASEGLVRISTLSGDGRTSASIDGDSIASASDSTPLLLF